MKGFDHFRIELPARPVVQLLRRGFVGLAASIHAIACDRVERISHCKDARADIDLFVAQTEWITSAVPLLVMLGHHARRAFEKLDPAQDLLPMKRMFAHSYPFFL